MGLGTLFIGYFLLLNVTYFGYTDLLAGLIMLMGLYKLLTINKQFKNAFVCTSAFSVLGAAELVISLITTFMPLFKEEAILVYLTPARYVILLALSFFVMLGIRDVADEVGLKILSKKAGYYAYVSLIAFALAAIMDIPFLTFISAKGLAIISLLVLSFVFITIAIDLSVIYKAYMKICMPSDLVSNTEEKKSRFEFVNKFRDYEKGKQREYAEYKLSKMNAKPKAKNKKKGKRK